MPLRWHMNGSPSVLVRRSVAEFRAASRHKSNGRLTDFDPPAWAARIGCLPPSAEPSRRQVKSNGGHHCVTLRSGALWCTAVRGTSVRIESAAYAQHAFLGHLALCAATNRRPLGLLSCAWTRIYATALCRFRNPTARARPQRRQRQRHFASSTFRLSGVSRWPLPQISGMAMDSRTQSGEKDTT